MQQKQVEVMTADAAGVCHGPWQKITEDDLLYCILFSADGQAHSNRPYCEEMGYGSNFFYGDATVGLLMAQFHRTSGLPESRCTVRGIDVTFTTRVHIGDEIRARYVLRPPDNEDTDGVWTVTLDGIKPDGTVVMQSTVTLTVS